MLEGTWSTRRVPRTAALVLRASTAFVQSKTDQMAAPSGAPPRSQTAVDCALACCVPGAVDVVLSPTMARRAMHLMRKFHFWSRLDTVFTLCRVPLEGTPLVVTCTTRVSLQV